MAYRPFAWPMGTEEKECNVMRSDEERKFQVVRLTTTLPYVNSVCVNNVSNKSKHGNTSVLDLRFTKEANGGFWGGVPEVLFSQTQGVEESDNRVAFLCQIS